MWDFLWDLVTGVLIIVSVLCSLVIILFFIYGLCNLPGYIGFGIAFIIICATLGHIANN